MQRLAANVLPLLALSGAECVDALVAAGFTVVERADGRTTLSGHLRVVVVPDVPVLPPEAFEEILRASGVAYLDFLELLADAPTQPHLEVGESGAYARVRVRDTG